MDPTLIYLRFGNQKPQHNTLIKYYAFGKIAMKIVGELLVNKQAKPSFCSVTKIFQSKLKHLMYDFRSLLRVPQVVVKINAKHL